MDDDQTPRSGVHAQVFEVIVRQAMAGAPWKQICAGPMKVCNIDPEEIEEEVRRRKGGGGSSTASGKKTPKTPPAKGKSSSQERDKSKDFVPGSGSYGIGVRAQVFEVIVRQALAGAPWKEICAGPMQVNNINADDIEDEVRRRREDDDNQSPSPVRKKPKPPKGEGGISLPLPPPDKDET
jgi:hypothetical protein